MLFRSRCSFYGGYETNALSWSGRGEYLSVARWQRLNEPDQRPSVQATIRTRRLSDAIALRASLHTIRRMTDDPAAPAGNPDAWLYLPCAIDSVDSFTWTRYDLRAVRIRVPREIRRVPVPEVNELHFQKGRAKMRLRLASRNAYKNHDAESCQPVFGYAQQAKVLFTFHASSRSKLGGYAVHQQCFPRIHKMRPPAGRGSHSGLLSIFTQLP